MGRFRGISHALAAPLFRCLAILALGAGASTAGTLIGTGSVGATAASSWSGTSDIDGSNYLISISCPEVSFCTAIDQEGYAVTYNGITWSSPRDIDGSNYPYKVSCASATFCVAVDEHGNAITFNGTTWTPTEIDYYPGYPSEYIGLSGVSCLSSSFCVAADYDGNVLTFNGNAWSAATNVDEYPLMALSCASTSFCVGLDEEGGEVTYDGSGWSPRDDIDGYYEFMELSCPSPGSCVATDDDGNALVLDGTTWSAPSSIDGGAYMYGLSCTSATSCVATDYEGNALVYDGSTWTVTSGVDEYPVTALDCPAPAFCVGVDPEGHALTYLDTAAVGAPSAVTSTVTALQTTEPATGTDTSNVLVTLLDANGNPVSGKSVSLAGSVGGGGTFGGTVSAAATTSVAGVAYFTVSDATSQTAILAATDTSDAVPLDDTAAVEFEPLASVTSSTVTATPTSLSADGEAPVTVTVTLKDAAKSALAGKTVELYAEVSGGGEYGGSYQEPEVTSSKGVATFSVTDTDAQTVTYMAQDVTDGDLWLNGTTQTPIITFTPALAVATKSTLVASAADVATGEAAAASVTATLKDSSGKPLAGRTVNLLRSPSTWSAASSVDGTNIISAVSCTDTADCVAVDAKGNALSESAGTWAAASDADGDNYPSSVSCPSTTFCVAVDNTGAAVTYNGTTWSDPVSVTTNALTSVTCPTTAVCVAVDAKGNAYALSSGTWSAVSTSTGTDLTSVSCASATFCATVDSTGDAFTYSGTTGKAFVAADGTTGLTSVSCPTATFCMAVDDAGNALTFNGKTWSAAASVGDGGADLVSVSCPTATFCGLVDGAGNALAFNGKTWSTPVDIDGTTALTGVSCPSAANCVAVDSAGNALTFSGYTGPPVVTGSNGTAVFTIGDNTAEKVTYTATDTTDGVTLPSASVTFSAPVASATTSTVAASTTKALGSEYPTATVSVTVKNASGAVLPNQSVSLTPSATTSPNYAYPLSNVTTNAVGVATFGVEAYVPTTAQTVTYTAADTTGTAVTLAKTVTVTFEPMAPGPSSTFTATSTQVAADGSSTTMLTATMKNAAGEPLADTYVELSSSVTSGSSDAEYWPVDESTYYYTNAEGVVQFYASDADAQDVSFTAEDCYYGCANAGKAATVDFDPTTPTAATITSTGPTTVSADGVSPATIAVTVKDAAGAPLANKTIAIAGSVASGTYSGSTPGSEVTNASGIATFEVTDAAVQAVTYTITDTTDGSGGTVAAKTRSVSFTAPTASVTLSTVAASAKTAVANSVAPVTVTVTVKNASGDPMAGTVVSLSGTVSGGTYDGLTPVAEPTNGAGVATFVVTDGTPQAVAFGATSPAFSGASVTKTATVTFTAPVLPA